MQESQMFGKFLEILKLLIAILARILFGHFPCRVFSLVSALNSWAASPLFYAFFKRNGTSRYAKESISSHVQQETFQEQFSVKSYTK